MKRTITIIILMLALILPVNAPLSGGSYVASAADSGSSTAQSVPLKEAVPVVSVAAYKDATRIQWEKVSGASYYNVYRATSASGKYKKLKKTKSLSYSDTKGESGKTYYYKVRAYKSKRKYSKYSAPVAFKTIYRVYIACGHGTSSSGIWDPGCLYNGMQEAQLMLPITQDFVSYMRKSGVYVYTDADNGNKLNLNKCVKAANKKKLSAYISVHCDWRFAPSGSMPLYKSKSDLKLASALNAGVLQTIPYSTRGVTRRTGLKELNKTKAVSCIFETGSISQDYEVFINQHDLYGKGLALGLCNYLGIPLVE